MIQTVMQLIHFLAIAPITFFNSMRSAEDTSPKVRKSRIVGSKATLFASPSLTVCGPLQLGEVITDLRNGWSPQCLERPATEDEWGVLKVGAVSYGWFDDRQNKALPPTLQPKPSLEVKPGEVIISRANILRLVGACAIVRETRPCLLLCDKLFRVEFLKDSPMLPDFLAEVLKTHSVRQQIEAGAIGTSPTMKNISKSALLELTFSVPTGPDGLKIQERMISNLEAARLDVRDLRAQAAKARTAAWGEFLAAIFE